MSAKKILVINDSEDFLKFLKLLLEDNGYSISCLSDPCLAIKNAKAFSPDIILIDINMPRLNGYDLTSLIRKDKKTRDIYIIVCSATNYGLKDIEKAIQSGANDFIYFPSEPNVIITRLNLALINISLMKDKKRALKDLQYQKNLLNDLMDNTPDIIYFKDRKGRLILVNSAHAKGHGKITEDLIGKTDFELFPLKEAEKMTIDDLYVMETRKPIVDRLEFTTRPNGETNYVSTTKIPRFDSQNRVIGIMGITRIITPRIMAEKALVEEKGRTEQIINSSTIPIFVLDNSHRIISWNPACEKLTGILRADVMGKDCHGKIFYGEKRPCLADLIIDKRYDDISRFYRKFEPVDFFTDSYAAESWYENLNGKRRYLRVTASPLKNDKGEIIGAIENMQDITEHKEMEEDLQKSKEAMSELALKDPLTGLYNYRYFMERLTAEFKRAQRYSLPLSLAMIDLDYFKSINDAYGHQFGDVILKQVGDFLRSFCRENDVAVRFGGEEFVFLLPDTDLHGLKDFLRRLSSSFKARIFAVNSNRIKLNASVGAANFPEVFIENETDLIEMADSALRKAKDLGGNRVEIYQKLSEIPSGDIDQNRCLTDLHTKIVSMEKRRQQSLVEFLFAFSKSLESEKFFSREHTEKIVALVEKIGKRLKLDRTAIDNLRNASALYDIGKICVDEKILFKKDRLSAGEFEEIKKHPRVSAEIIREVDVLKGAVPAVLYHHEKYDGTGYAFGLKGKQIPLSARILSVADAFDALTSDRPYRKAYKPKEALNIIEKESGKNFDPDVVKALLDVQRN